MKTAMVENLKEQPKLELADRPMPEIRDPREVLIQVVSVGLDGTDREIRHKGYGEAPAGESGLIPGHEMVGVVKESGPLSAWNTGDWVTMLVRRPCGIPSCRSCSRGRPDYCETGQYQERGIRGLHGFLAEWVVEHENYLVRIPKEDRLLGVLAEPQSIVEKALEQMLMTGKRLDYEPRRALVLGSGPLGLLSCFTCRSLGLETTVWSLSPSDSPEAERVRSCGAEYVQAAANESEPPSSTLTSYAKQTGLRPDWIMECTGYSPLAFEAMEVSGANGCLSLLGVSAGERQTTLDTNRLNLDLVLKNKAVVGSVNAAKHHFHSGLDRLAAIRRRWPGLLESVMTDRFSLQELEVWDFGKVEVKGYVELKS